MKKNLIILLISLFFSFSAQATIHTVTVADFSFTPSSMTVLVGDTILWTWIQGSHTTTSTSIPGGALSWDAPISNSSFSYRVTVEGTYNYHCTIHPNQMIGNFTAIGTLGILPVESNSSFLVNTTLVSNNLQITYKLDKSSRVDLRLFDISGKQVNKFSSSNHVPGIYTETYSLSNLSKGEYVLELRSNDIVASRKIVIE